MVPGCGQDCGNRGSPKAAESGLNMDALLAFTVGRRVSLGVSAGLQAPESVNRSVRRRCTALRPLARGASADEPPVDPGISKITVLDIMKWQRKNPWRRFLPPEPIVNGILPVPGSSSLVLSSYGQVNARMKAPVRAVVRAAARPRQAEAIAAAVRTGVTGGVARVTDLAYEVRNDVLWIKWIGGALIALG